MGGQPTVLIPKHSPQNEPFMSMCWVLGIAQMLAYTDPQQWVSTVRDFVLSPHVFDSAAGALTSSLRQLGESDGATRAACSKAQPPLSLSDALSAFLKDLKDVVAETERRKPVLLTEGKSASTARLRHLAVNRACDERVHCNVHGCSHVHELVEPVTFTSAYASLLHVNAHVLAKEHGILIPTGLPVARCKCGYVKWVDAPCNVCNSTGRQKNRTYIAALHCELSRTKPRVGTQVEPQSPPSSHVAHPTESCASLTTSQIAFI